MGTRYQSQEMIKLVFIEPHSRTFFEVVEQRHSHIQDMQPSPGIITSNAAITAVVALVTFFLW